jgi:hypothetical protein
VPCSSENEHTETQARRESVLGDAMLDEAMSLAFVSAGLCETGIDFRFKKKLLGLNGDLADISLISP